MQCTASDSGIVSACAALINGSYTVQLHGQRDISWILRPSAQHIFVLRNRWLQFLLNCRCTRALDIGRLGAETNIVVAPLFASLNTSLIARVAPRTIL